MSPINESWGSSDAAKYLLAKHGPDGARFLDTHLQSLLSQKRIEGKQAVDIGCGTGTWTQYLLDQGVRHVWAFDTNPAMVMKTTENLQQSHPNERGRYFVDHKNAIFTDYRAEMFDVLLSANVGCNLDEIAFDRHFREAHRIAKQGAILVVSAPNSLNTTFTNGHNTLDIQDFIDTQWNHIEDPKLRNAKYIIEQLRDVYRATFVLDEEGKPELVTPENADSLVLPGDPIMRRIPGLAVGNNYHTADEYIEAAEEAGWQHVQSFEDSFAHEEERAAYNATHGSDAQLGPEYVKNPAFFVAEFRKVA